MSEKITSDDNVDANILKQQGDQTSSSCSSSYSIEVCQGPDCTGLGGGVAILEIEELVREHQYQNNDGSIKVIAGGCRDFCSVGPNVHIHVCQKIRGRKTNSHLLESFQNVNKVSSCSRVFNTAAAYASSSKSPIDEENINESPPVLSSSGARHRSMMARRAERQRWEALKDISRTIAKSKKLVASQPNVQDCENIKRKLKVWKETCQDRLEQEGKSIGQSPREQRRAKHLAEIATEKLDRICLQNDGDESDTSSYTSSSDETDTSEK